MLKSVSDSKLIRLTELKKGQEGTVTDLDTDNAGILKKLMSMGVLPGMPLKLIQTFPSYVFQAGYTQVAVDREIAAAIVVNIS